MKNLTWSQKLCLMIVENLSVFMSVFLNQMIITVFPAYDSVKVKGIVHLSANGNSSSHCQDTDASNSFVAILIGAKYCTELLALPFVGFLSDHCHPPLVLFAGLIAETVACIVYSATGNFYLTIVARVVDGIGNSLVSTSGLTIIYMIYVRDRPRNRLVTIESVMAYVSAYLSPFAAGYVYESLADRSESIARFSTFMMLTPLFMILAVMTVPFAFSKSGLLWFRVPVIGKPAEVAKEEEEEYKCEPRVVKRHLSACTLLRDPHIVLILVMLTMNSLVCNSLETSLPIYMSRKFCSDQRQQGTVWLFGTMSLGGFFLSTFLFHVRPSVCWLLPLVGLLVNGALCLLVPYCQPWWTIGIVLGLMSFCNSVTDVILIPLVPKILDLNYLSGSYGSTCGLTLITFTISGLLGSFPVGPIVDHFGFVTLCTVLCVSNLCLVPFMYNLRAYF